MRARRYIVALFLLFSGAAVLVVGQSLGFSSVAASDAPVFTSGDDHPYITVWKRIYEKPELEMLPLRSPDTAADHDLDATYVRPAWGMLAVVMGVFYYVWAMPHAGTLLDLIQTLRR